MSAMKTLSALFLAAALAGAIPTPGAPVALARAEAAQALISTREAISAALRAYPGAEALDARLVDGGRPYYIVRLMQGGRRFDVRVDAQTGQVG